MPKAANGAAANRRIARWHQAACGISAICLAPPGDRRDAVVGDRGKRGGCPAGAAAVRQKLIAEAKC